MKQVRSEDVSAGRRGPRGGDVRGEMIAAAFETLRTRGFKGATARAIAQAGGFNSALIFYYFGTVNGLLLAALDHSSEQRMARYRAIAESATGVEELAAAAAQIYSEDVEGGHITVFSELVGASLFQPDLAPEIVARAQPWIDFVEDTLNRFVAGTAFEGLLPTRDLAFAVIAFYMGVNLLTHLDLDRSRIERLFALVRQFAPLAQPLLDTLPAGPPILGDERKK